MLSSTEKSVMKGLRSMGLVEGTGFLIERISERLEWNLAEDIYTLIVGQYLISPQKSHLN